ncbi:hypothetical protein C2845_PM16G18820 [Panicum miliaceum]|uniref:DUF1985 domain-containing protein n=1 Tax=Panicum miliaceum TaxID=4540 RepID=A0A3L6PVI6_PANMI|nr:hypothetical protein C2845_PM16G18820 [Panicum miliaceum]
MNFNSNFEIAWDLKINRGRRTGGDPHGRFHKVPQLEISSDEREDVKKFGFGAFLNLKLEKPCKPQEAVHLLSVSELQKDHVAMKVLPDVTLNFRPDVVEKLLKVPRGTSKLPHFGFIAQKAEFKKLREQLGMEGSIEIKKLLKKLEDLKEATEATDKALKLGIFFLIVISNYLIPKARNLACTEVVLYTSDMTKIADYDWCTIVYEHMRHVKETYKPGSQIAGCIIAWLVYFLDNLRTEAPNIDEDEDETENEDMDEIARINLYDEAVVKKMSKNIQFRDGMFVFRNLQLSFNDCVLLVKL